MKLKPTHQLGFTLIEMITVLIIASILLYVALPKISDKVFEERALYEATKVVLQQAQRSAVASRRYVCVDINSTSGIIELNRDENYPEDVKGNGNVDCRKPLALPLSLVDDNCAKNNQLCATQGLAFMASQKFIFDAQGRIASATDPDLPAANDVVISITNSPEIRIIAATGFIQ